jgi:sugar phosphate isomerase/epimerase
MATLELNWGTVRQGSLLELIDAAVVAGFGSITVPPPWYDAALLAGHTAGELRARLEDAGLVVGYIDALTAGLPGQPSGSAPARYQNTFENCITAALGLGARRLSVAHFGGAKTDIGALTDAIGDVATRARNEGVAVVVEFIPGTGIPDLATAVRIVVDVGVADVGVLLDTWHHYRSVGSVAEGATIPFELVHALQLSDMPAERVGCWRAGDPQAAERNSTYVPMTGRLLPGDGVLPLAEVIGGLLAARPEVPVGIEIFNDEMRAMTVERAAAESAKALRTML